MGYKLYGNRSTNRNFQKYTIKKVTFNCFLVGWAGGRGELSLDLNKRIPGANRVLLATGKQNKQKAWEQLIIRLNEITDGPARPIVN